MYKKILAPLDGSKLSESSLPHVKAIATGCETAEVIVMRAVEPERQIVKVDEDLRKGVEEGVKAAAKEYVAKIANQLKKEGLPAKGVVAKGKAEETIMDYATKNNIDLIVMSTHGRSGISRWATGSVTDRVARYSAIPVLLISPAASKQTK